MAEPQGQRMFLFLEGPHGPFYRLLAQALIARGAAVRRILLNRADAAEWGRGLPATRFTGTPDVFREWLAQQIDALGVTDIVLYGDSRPAHQVALAEARTRGITTHILEEGYVRPRFVTYERQGTNAFSRLCDISLPRMAEAVGQVGPPDEQGPSDTWGDSRQHLILSCLYYIRLALGWRAAGSYGGARGVPVWREIAWYWLRAMVLPYIRLRRAIKQSRLIRSGRTFHLVLLQLSFDASMRVHSDYENSAAFVEEVIDAFAEGAPADHLLVFKAHPFDNGRERLRGVIRSLAADLGIAERVMFIDGGKRLARLMDAARSALTVNSTGAQQALWRGLPVVATGRSIYRKPGLTSEQSLAGFFRHPRRPDLRAYWIFRKFMIDTTQLPGSFYAKAGITRLLAALPDAMMASEDPYDRVLGQQPGTAGTGALTRPSLIVSNVDRAQNLR